MAKTLQYSLVRGSAVGQVCCPRLYEVIAGAKALGKCINPKVIEQQIRATREMGSYRPSSMIDYLEGSAVEVDAIWAEPLRRAEAAGARLPHWSRLLSEIRMHLAERS